MNPFDLFRKFCVSYNSGRSSNLEAAVNPNVYDYCDCPSVSGPSVENISPVRRALLLCSLLVMFIVMFMVLYYISHSSVYVVDPDYRLIGVNTVTNTVTCKQDRFDRFLKYLDVNGFVKNLDIPIRYGESHVSESRYDIRFGDIEDDPCICSILQKSSEDTVMGEGRLTRIQCDDIGCDCAKLLSI